MGSALDQCGSATVSAAPAALARAWQAVTLYGCAHQAVAQRIDEFCESVGQGSHPLRLFAEPGRIVVAGSPLEPRDLFAPLADLLQRAGLAILEIRGRIEPAQAMQLLTLLDEARCGDAPLRESLPKRLADASGGSVRTQRLSAQNVRLRAIAPTAETGDRRRDLALHELDQSQRSAPGTSPQAGAAAATGNDGSDIADPAVGAIIDMAASSAPGADHSQAALDLHSIRNALDHLSDDQRRQVLEALGHGGQVAFDDAARVLSLMPVRDVTDAIAVLERPDAHVSSTALMLLRRLAHLALGSSIDLDRLTRVAEQWAAGDPQQSSQRGELARTTASLLRRMSEGEFRPDEYSHMLAELSAAPCEGPPITNALAADDIAQMHRRAVDVVCESLDRRGIDAEADAAIDASGSLRFLCERTASVADLGLLSTVMRVRAIAGRFSTSKSGGEVERKAARAILDAAESEQWLARALAGTSDQAQARANLETLRRGNGAAVITMYLAAITHAPAGPRMQALLGCRDMFAPNDLKRAVAQHVTREPAAAGSLMPLIQRALPEHMLELLRPALLGGDDRVRRQAFAALQRARADWPDDLQVRGLLDADESVRLAAIDAISRANEDRRRLLVDRLAGRMGEATLASGEVQALRRVLDADSSGALTRRMARGLIARSVLPMHILDCRPLAAALAARAKTPLSLLALTLCKVSPIQWLGRRGGREAARA